MKIRNAVAAATVLAALFAAFGGGLWVGQSVTERRYEEILAAVQEMAGIDQELAEERCGERTDKVVLAILSSLDMQCLGRWSAADGEVVLYPHPDELKRGAN